MKKIPTLFNREFQDHNVISISPEVSKPELAWVLAGEGVATEKIDGACCAIIDGRFYKRYDAKKNKNGVMKTPPADAIPCDEPDPITGHWPYWMPVDENVPADHWFVVAMQNTPGELTDGTYEAVGPHFNSNPHHMDQDVLVRHGEKIIPLAGRSFDCIREYLAEHNIEGMRLAKKYPGKRITVLNFASATNPGGGVAHGSSAQEESLCRCSTLYPTLDRRFLWQEYYNVNRASANVMHTDACIYSPGVVICKTDADFPERMPHAYWISVDVISCAAPNLRNTPANLYNPESGRRSTLCRQNYSACMSSAPGASLPWPLRMVRISLCWALSVAVPFVMIPRWSQKPMRTY